MLQNFSAKRRELRGYLDEYSELQVKVIELDTPVSLEFLLQKLAPNTNTRLYRSSFKHLQSDSLLWKITLIDDFKRYCCWK